MKYITIRRFRDKAICGEVNIPALTEIQCVNNILYWNGKPLCIVTSENAHQFFAINEDGNGLERGKLTQAIQKTLEKRDSKYQERWDKIWADPLCLPYKRKEHENFWLWNHDFFNADIDKLRYIANLVGATI